MDLSSRRRIPARLAPNRPTVAQARAEYDGSDLFDGMLVVGAGKVAHRAEQRTGWAGALETWTTCGRRGNSRPARDKDLVCLVCFPWWYA